MFRRATPALLLLAPLFASGQTASSVPEFEAASVRPVPPGTPYGGMRGGPGTSSPGQIHYEATTLRAIVARAYGVQRFQIEGPQWFDDVRFDIVAKIPPGTTTAQLQLMLQSLLAERFHLQFHAENRRLPVYEMIIAKSGVKMRPVAAPVTPQPRVGGASAPSSGGISLRSQGEKMELLGRAVTMRQLLVWLNDTTHHEIADKSGLTGAYDFEVLWTPDSSAEQNDQFSADIFDANIEKALGLKIVTRKDPIEVLVIDRLDRTPTEN